MMTSAPQPLPAPSEPVPDIEEIRLDRDRRHLHLAFSGRPAVPASLNAPAQRAALSARALRASLSAPALRASLSAPALRAACRCAACVADQARGTFSADFAGVTLTHVAPFGAHGLNLSFSDGHARGVYPFAYLAALAADAAGPDLPEVKP
ncbi:gamma-butyrobetaine hydroxylase-like domain-containing protein [Xanthobacter versatilis]|uniref:gamma-butyrobetaine hydroxylase-like domain-containing protein n=1 Tax=Xanthobacter autotrophicus (strain ATCC BAA-1158 / Py2) TaxID=78245 RepID=UPI003726FE3A